MSLLDARPAAVDDVAERLPAEISAAELRTYCSLTPADLDQVAHCRGPPNNSALCAALC